MTGRTIEAITFDLWDTVFVDDSDEPKRAAQGLLPKAGERRRLVHEFLSRHEPLDRGPVDVAYDTADAAFSHVWHVQHHTWTVRQRLSVLLRGLRRSLPEDEMKELVRLHEEMELAVRPDLAPGIGEALARLRGRYRLGVVSDAIFSPGRALRELLAGYGILSHFDCFVFSDEFGCSKPRPELFAEVAAGLGVDLRALVHVGDREENDVAGPHAVGARAVLVTVAKDRGSSQTKADAVCHDYAELPAIIDAMARTDA